MIKKLVRAIRVARNWVRALNHAATEDFEKVIKYAEACERISKANPKFTLLKAWALGSIFRNEDSIDSLKIAKEKIKVYKKYNQDEKDYLYCYIRFLVEAMNKSDQVSGLGTADYNLSKVSGDLKSVFPIPSEEST